MADGLPQPLQNARKLEVNFFETLLPGKHKMGLNPIGLDVYFERLRPGGILFAQPILP